MERARLAGYTWANVVVSARGKKHAAIVCVEGNTPATVKAMGHCLDSSTQLIEQLIEYIEELECRT